MNNFIFMAGLILLFAACSKESENMVNNAQMEGTVAPVKVHVTGFSVSQEDYPITRAAQNVANYQGVESVTLAFYNGSTEVLKTTQLKGDATTYDTFGVFECTLPMGSYTMVVVAYKTMEDSPFELTSATSAAYTGAHVFETFSATQAVNIVNTSAVDISATLNRIVSKLEVHSSDGRTANATNIRMTFAAGGKGFNPSTGLATANTGFANTVGISAEAGATSNSVSYLFLASDTQNINVTIETLDGDGNTLFSKTVENVPFKRNRVTILTGAMYSNAAVDGSFELETSWLSNYNGNF